MHTHIFSFIPDWNRSLNFSEMVNRTAHRNEFILCLVWAEWRALALLFDKIILRNDKQYTSEWTIAYRKCRACYCHRYNCLCACVCVKEVVAHFHLQCNMHGIALVFQCIAMQPVKPFSAYEFWYISHTHSRTHHSIWFPAKFLCVAFIVMRLIVWSRRFTFVKMLQSASDVHVSVQMKQ